MSTVPSEGQLHHLHSVCTENNTETRLPICRVCHFSFLLLDDEWPHIVPGGVVVAVVAAITVRELWKDTVAIESQMKDKKSTASQH